MVEVTIGDRVAGGAGFTPWSNWVRQSRPARRVLGLGSLVVVLMLAVTTAVAIRRYNAEIKDAARELRTLDIVLAEETGRSLQSVELVLRSVADQIGADNVHTPEDFVTRASTRAMHDVLRARVAGVPQLDAITMISTGGKLVNFSRYWPIPDVDLNDRDYFRQLRDTKTDESFLSEPVLNRGSGTPTIYLARQIGAPDGTVVGLVLGAIELAYFERFYASLHLGEANFIALWRQDGVLLARHPPAEIGQRIAPAAITSPSRAWHGIDGVFEKDWTIGNGPPARRIVASQAVPGFPVQINLGRDKAFILADWRREVTTVGGAVGTAVLCVLLLMWALLRRFHAYEAMMAASREREAAVMGRREAEDALRQAQKMEAVGQLTGGVAHDFNNLLTVVRASVDLLRRPRLTDERRTRYIDAIADAAERATKLTGQLLAFARRQTLKPEVFDVVGSVAAVAALVDRLTGSRVEVETVLPEVPCFVEADRNQFDTAIVNMAVNGRDAMPDGGRLTIAVEAAERIPAVRAHPAREGRYVAVSVRDRGTGIAPDVLERIFEPFFTTKTVGQGTGLGLSQVFGFAKQSGGDVSVSTDPGGTVFTLYLPRAPGAPVDVAPEGADADAGPGALRVLVVEDDAEVGRAIAQTLIELGHAPAWVEGGERALAELAAGRDRFDLVLSDVVMRGMSGIDLERALRRDLPDLPVVLMSGYSHVLAERGARGLALLQKPYSIDELSRALRAASRTQSTGDS